MTHDRPPVLLITQDLAVTRQISDLAGSVPIAAAHPESLTEATWAEAQLIIVDEQVSAAVAAHGLPTRRNVVLLTRGPADPNCIQRCESVGGEDVIRLPKNAAWLQSRILAAAKQLSLMTVVVGGHGGVGASTLSAALATAAEQLGLRTALVGADPMSDLFAAVPDFLSDTDVRTFQQADDGFTVIPPEVLSEAVDRLRAEDDVVVIDGVRHPDGATAWAITRADLTLVLTSPDERALAGTTRVLRWAAPLAHHLGLIVRRAPQDPPAHEVADQLRLDCLGELLPGQENLLTLGRNLITHQIPSLAQTDPGAV